MERHALTTGGALIVALLAWGAWSWKTTPVSPEELEVVQNPKTLPAVTTPCPSKDAAGQTLPAILGLIRASADETERKERILSLARLRDRSMASAMLDAVIGEKDAEVVETMLWSLASMADAALVQQIALRSKSTSDSEIRGRLGFIIERVRNPNAASELAKLAPADVPAREVLARAGLHALRQMGTPYALAAFARRLDAANKEDEGFLAESMARFDQPGLQEELIAIAQGKQDATRTITRLAALLALGNYQDSFTREAVASLVQDSDPQVAREALRISRRGG